MPLSIAKLSEYMEHDLNIYITGEAGTGKTFCLKEAAKEKGYKIGYMSAPTLDAYVDLVGIPLAEYDKTLKRKVLQFIRKAEFEDIEGLFIDELPRGELKTLNAVFEIIQEGTINGENAMPKLKFVVAAGNPLTDDYAGQQQLDFALLDRFDMFLETDIAPDLPFFIKTFGKPIGKVLVEWHQQHNHKEKGYLSPRRLEKIGHTWLLMPEISTLKNMMTPGGTFNVDLLQKNLLEAVQGTKDKKDTAAPLVNRLPFMENDEIRDSRELILAGLPSMNRQDRAITTEAISRAIRNGVRVDTILRDWAPALEYFSNTDKTTMMSSWPAARSTEFLKKSGEQNLVVGSKLKG